MEFTIPPKLYFSGVYFKDYIPPIPPLMLFLPLFYCYGYVALLGKNTYEPNWLTVTLFASILLLGGCIVYAFAVVFVIMISLLYIWTT